MIDDDFESAEWENAYYELEKEVEELSEENTNLKNQIHELRMRGKKKIKEECYSLDYYLIIWLNVHLKQYLEDASKFINLEMLTFKYKKKKYTQRELIERLIEITTILIGENGYYNTYFDWMWSEKDREYIGELISEMYDILKIIHFDLWW